MTAAVRLVAPDDSHTHGTHPMSFDPGAAASPDSGVFGLEDTPQQAGVVFIPVPFDATCSYRPGTAAGPAAIEQASRQVDLFDAETGHPYRAGMAMLPHPQDVAGWNAQARQQAEPVLAAGGVVHGNPALQQALEQVNALSSKMNQWVEATAEHWLGQGKLVGVVGGDHSVPFGSIKAHARRYPGMGILHVDAHADLRAAYEGFTWSHASIFHNVMTRIPEVSQLVQVGIRDLCQDEWDMAQKSNGRIHLHHDATMKSWLHEGQAYTHLVERMIAPLPQQVYISVDIDGLDPSLCPHTGTPVPGGLSFAELGTLLRLLVRSGRRVVGFDLTEVAPGPAGNEWDANVGARVLYKLTGWALLSRR